MEVCCLDHFRKTVNVSNFYENGGGYVHQSNDTVQEFYLHLSDSQLQNAATTTTHLISIHYWQKFLRKTNNKSWNNVGSNIRMRKLV